ncbi:putative lipase [Dietzia sp. NCCP-2495]|uniref:lipase family protein n=1 Tax=Dietzia sp. NCCP-2495 TaxID=2934675 RepID=UPI0022302056|nr:lipase family protein [Dietzia sp. NCCP-2495]GLB63768.1 putative lipase [Dietzia sp. NCCP-2495]
MTPRPRPLLGRLITATVLATACTLAGTLAVTTTAAADPLAAVRPALVDQRTPERYLPSPSPDPWYSNPPRIDPATAPGTILDTREVTVPPYNMANFGRGWQVLVQSTDSRDQPQQIISTILEPSTPWDGPGPRPLIAYNAAIDSLGLECMPSWKLTNDVNLEVPPSLQILTQRGYGLVVTDFEGPKGAYAAGRGNGHAVLDGIRAAHGFVPPGEEEPLFGDSRVVQTGYSGGAIAAGWAAQLQPVYAPELTGVLVGSSIGGVPSDYTALFDTMDGTLGSGLYRAAIFGLARDYPELYPLLNDTGDVAAHQLRDACVETNLLSGVLHTPLSTITDVDPRTDPTVRRVLAHNRMGAVDTAAGDDPRAVPTGPVQVWHADSSVPIGPGSSGIGDTFIPETAARRLVDEWCAAGADVEYTPVAGEHLSAPFTGMDPSLDWVDARARGIEFTGGCRA